MPHERLARPPIVEALLDFRVHPSASGDEAVILLEELAPALRAEYPDEVEQPDLTQGLQGSLARFVPQFLWARGRRFRSADGLRTVLVSPDRLTVGLSFRPPDFAYSDWTDLEREAFGAWELYQTSTRPLALVRLATRFVNRLAAPAGSVASYFKAPPELPITNATLTAFNDRRGGLTDDGFGVQTGRRLDPQQPTSVFMDVEAFRAYGDAAPEPPVQRKHLAADLARLRKLKNDLFHGSLTEAALDRYRDAAS